MFRCLQYVFVSLCLISCVFADPADAGVSVEKVHLVVFGDSWSDDGNICKATNDKVWNEYIKDMNPSYVVHNYAGCGAKTKDLKTEIDAFLKDHQIGNDETVVYVVWISGNDYIELGEDFQNLAANSEDSFSLGVGVMKSVARVHLEAPKKIFKEVERLRNEGPGSRKFVFVGNLPNFSIFPATSPMQAFARISTGSVDKLVGNLLDALSVTHNVRVSKFVDAYAAEQNVRLLNFYRFFERVTKDPKQHGIDSLEFECTTKEKCESELFHDVIHFNHRGHYLIAGYVNMRVTEALNGSENLNDREEHTVQEDVLCMEAEQVLQNVEGIYKEYVPEHIRNGIAKAVEGIGEFLNGEGEMFGTVQDAANKAAGAFNGYMPNHKQREKIRKNLNDIGKKIGFGF
jgi:phospholipase/lecithinase/hemolysin